MWNKIAMVLLIVFYAFQSATVILAWFTPELETPTWRLVTASVTLAVGWYYILSKTAAERHWNAVKSWAVRE